MATFETSGGEGTAANLRGAGLMVVAMAFFAAEDALIKLLGGRYAAAQIIWMLGLGGATVLGAWVAATGRPFPSRALLQRGVVLRTGFEVMGTLFFVSAIVSLPLSTASAVIQATPLVVAMGAALFLGATVGWRRWAAIAVGFGGVLLILRPGAESFDPATMLAVAGMLGLAGRDLATRHIPATTSSVQLSLAAFAALVPAGLGLQLATGIPVRAPEGLDFAVLAACVGLGLGGYVAIVGATRIGDIAFVSSFRYSRMLFALILGMAFYEERPDAATVVGVAVVIASGLYALVRESRQRRALPPGRPGG